MKDDVPTEDQRIERLEQTIRRLQRQLILVAVAAGGFGVAAFSACGSTTKVDPLTKLAFTDGSNSIEITAGGIAIKEGGVAATTISAGSMIVKSSPTEHASTTMIDGHQVTIKMEGKAVDFVLTEAMGPAIELRNQKQSLKALVGKEDVGLQLEHPNYMTRIGANADTAYVTSVDNHDPNRRALGHATLGISEGSACVNLRLASGTKPENQLCAEGPAAHK